MVKHWEKVDWTDLKFRKWIDSKFPGQKFETFKVGNSTHFNIKSLVIAVVVYNNTKVKRTIYIRKELLNG